MNPWSPVAFFLLNLGLAWLLIPLIIRRTQALVRGREHSFHQTHSVPVPRFGGLALVAAFVLTVLGAYLFLDLESKHTRENLGMVAMALCMFGLGFVDDIRPLGARKKLVGQVLISLATALLVSRIELFQNPMTGVKYELGVWGVGLTVLWLVALTNLINLIDGIDGLAGGLGLMLMVLLASVANAKIALLPIYCAAGIAGALVAFLRFNFPPAKIYLGDGGAYFLGFLIGVFSVRQSEKGTVAAALVAPLFALALPIIDVALALVRRGLKGLPLFRPDRRHLHHKLIGEGYSRRKTVLILYGFSVVCLLMAFGVFWSKGRWVPIYFGLVCLLVLVTASRLNFTRAWLSPAHLGSTLEVRKAAQYALLLCQWLELEAERSPSPESLWRDFEFLAGKLGFAQVRLEMNGSEKVWQSPVPPVPDQQLHCVMPLDYAQNTQMIFRADAEAMSKQVFDQLSELAAEAWMKSLTRWHAVHRAG